MEYLIVTGYSGAGKSLAVRALEDIGYYCVDNLPPALILQFSQHLREVGAATKRVAIVCDVRGGQDFGVLLQVFQSLKSEGVSYKILFLEAREEVLERRYKETRRRHPLSITNGIPTENALELERKILMPVYEMADYIVDTSLLSTMQLRESIVSLFAKNRSDVMQLNFISFGFKFGLPKNADLVFDVRCLRNPFYQPALKNKTGLDAEVAAFVLESEEAQGLLQHLYAMLAYTLPLYQKEGKSELTIAIGCTGGKHRSVTFAEEFTKLFKAYEPLTLHRDIERH
ncbi:RNase adapter RapZ [Ruminococcaceae bacterium OttesenSCG-928-N02]|nr:RNase adapter RapZ [Ruminococcaceae bacterium OttesenSCG-928-N02]